MRKDSCDQGSSPWWLVRMTLVGKVGLHGEDAAVI
jgi:hypothetical protein